MAAVHSSTHPPQPPPPAPPSQQHQQHSQHHNHNHPSSSSSSSPPSSSRHPVDPPSDIPTPPTSNIGDPSSSSPSALISDPKAMRGALDLHNDDTDDDDNHNTARHIGGNQADEEDGDEDHDETMREKSPLVHVTEEKVRNKRTSSGSYRQVAKKPASSSTSTTPSLMLMAIDGTKHQRTTPPVSSSRTTIHEDDYEGDDYSERASVLEDSARRHNKRVHRRRPSTSSISSHDDPQRSRTPSPILGDAYPYAGAASRPGHLGPPTPGPSAADIHALLYDANEDMADGAAHRPSILPDSSEINAIVAKVEDMGFKDGAHPPPSASSPSRDAELANMVHKLAQRALEQDSYIRHMEESLHNTRLTAVSVISSLTGSHANDVAFERQLRDRLEVELEGAQASARMLSSMLAKAQNRNTEIGRERAMSVEEEMRWAATLPASARKVSGGSSATVTAASPRANHAQGQQGPAGSPTPAGPPQGTATLPDHPGDETAVPKRESNVIGLGVMGTPGMPQPEYTDILDSPMSVVITERNKLAADKKYLRTRVRDAEAQLNRLENELKALRPFLVHGGARALMATSGPSAPNTPSHHHVSSTHQTPSRSRNRSQRRRKLITMGDAEAEHLLLAARRLNHARSMGSLPTFSEHSSPFKASSSRFPTGERPRTPPPRASASGAPRTPGTGGTTIAKTPRSTGAKSRSGGLMDSLLINGTPGASTGSPTARNKPLFAHHNRLDSNASNASFNGMDELLHAAQSVLTPRDRLAASKGGDGVPGQGPPGATPGASGAYFPPVKAGVPHGMTGGIFDNHHLAHDSPKRRRVSVTALDNERPRIFSASPQTRHLPGLAKPFPTSANARRLRTRTEGADAVAQSASPQTTYQGLRAQGTRDADDGGSVGPLSALDLLADQAAASQNPSQSSEPSNSDGERRDGFSSQEEGPLHDDGRDVRRRRGSAYGASHTTPRGSAASSLMAARARVSAAPLAYAHSIAPTSDYAQPRYPYPSHVVPGHPGGHPPTSMSSPVTPSHHLQSLPPMGDAYAPRGVTSSGHLGPGPVPPGYLNNNLPPINTALAHHHHPPGPHTHSGHGHPMHAPPPVGPMSAGPAGHHISHGHHHSLPGMHALTNGYPVGAPPPQPPGAGPPSPLSSPVTGGYPTPRHHKSSTSLDGSAHGSGPSQFIGHNGPPLPGAQTASAASGSGNSSGNSSSKAPKPKGGNTSPDKRLPYVRWTSEEDTKLKNAIAHYGQRWEAVAKAVGTRSYHQCRQRALLMRRKGMDPGKGFSGGTSGRGKSQDENGTASAESGTSAVEEGGDEEEADEVDDEATSA